MTDTGLAAFDSTLQKTNIWLGDVMEELRTTDRHRAYRALSATLHALRDRLPPHALAELSAHLPLLLRGVLFEGWSPSETHPLPRTVDAFLSPVQAAFRDENVGYAERAARAVFTVISRRLNEGEVEKMRHLLPADIRDLWPSPR